MKTKITKIMNVLDTVLTDTVWLSETNEIVSLADMLHVGNFDGTPKSIEDLDRRSLLGAVLSLQIRSDNFDVVVESLSDKELGLKVKQMVFVEAKKMLDAANQSSLKVA